MAGSDSMVDSNSMAYSSAGSKFEVGSDSDYTMGLGSVLLVSSVLGTYDNSDFVHSATGECFQPTTLQSTKGSFQHYDH